jgi:sarcosine oxidase
LLHVDVLVIGAGAMGSATAWSLARRGRTVLLSEQFEQGHARGSSHGAVRIFRLAYDDVHYVRMAQEALPLWRDLEADCGEDLLELTGVFDHGPTESIQPIANALAAAGASFERLHPSAAHERAPGLSFDDEVVFHPQGGRCFAKRTLLALQRRVSELGSDVRFSTPAVIDAVADDHVDFHVGDEAGRAGVVVVTAGTWVQQVFGSRVRLPQLTFDRERVVHFKPRNEAMKWPSFLHHVDPWRYGLHTPGEGLKIGGLRESQLPGSADIVDFDAPVLQANIDASRRHAERWVPGVEPEPIYGPLCSFTSTESRDFILDRVGPLVVGSPCSDHGFKFTPFIGSVLADLATGVTPSFDLTRHRLQSFS